MLLALAVLPLAGPAVPASQQIESKEAEAREVLAQIQELDSSLEHVIDEYNNAQVELDKIVAAQKLNEKRLKIARANLGTAQGTLEARLVQLYQNGSPDLVEILLGSSTLDEILDGIDTAARVSDQDAQILEEVRKFREEIKQREAELEQARSKQEQVVAERAAKRQEIESTLAQRQELLASIKDQIAEMRAAEREAPGTPRSGGRGPPRHSVRRRRRRRRAGSGLEVRRRRRHRHAVPGHPVPVGRRVPEHRLRLLRLHVLRLLAGRRLLPARSPRSTPSASASPARSSSPATSSSSTASDTSASTSAAISSSTRRTRATS